MIRTFTADRPPLKRESRIHRDLPALAERVLIIGLDGATWDVLEPMMQSGRMTNLKRFLAGSTHGVLESTKPPITPAAWTTFMTGKNPGVHGIFDFERYDPRTHRLSFNTTQSLSHVRTIWQMLGDKGLKVGAVNVPMTYPPSPVNGFLITGFETPGTSGAFTHPPELKDELLRRWPDYTFKNTWNHARFRADRVFAGNLAKICRSFGEGVDVTTFCGDRYGWDALMVVFKLVDNLQHKTWKYLDARWAHEHPRRRQWVADCFGELDVSLGRLFDYARQHHAHVWIMSDHGHGSLEGKAHPNQLLLDWGYLQLTSGAAQSTTRARSVVGRLFRRRRGRFAAEKQVERDLAVDFSRTRACVMHAGMYGFLYLNLAGRQPCGLVPPQDYERVRDELRERFAAVKVEGPDGRPITLFPHIYKPEELYGASREAHPQMPDLLLAPAEGLAVVRNLRGARVVRWLPWRRIEGTHRLDGVFAIGGEGVSAGRTVRAGIIDVAPTLLAMLGVRIPDDMQGRVIAEAFESPPAFETEPAPKVTATAPSDDVYSAAEHDILTRRLAELGYLE